jgi:uncharacterized protein
VTVYLDASVVVALMMDDDAFSARANAFIRSGKPLLIVSDFAATEFASAISRQVRTGQITSEHAREGFADFDFWSAAETQPAAVTAADLALAQVFLRRLDLPLRTGDAINIAIARRLGASLATFDAKMAASARTLGVAVCDA